MEILSSTPSRTLKTIPKSRFPIPLARCSPRFGAFPFTAVVFLLFLAGASGLISYSDHCDDVVRDTPLLPDPNPPLGVRNFPSLHRAYFGCGINRTDKDKCAIPRSLSFSTQNAYRTEKDTIFKIEAGLSVNRVWIPPNLSRRGLRLVHFRPPRIPVLSGGPLRSSVSGFWDSSSGKLCVIGTGYSYPNHVVMKLDYLNSSNIFTSLVNGTLEILDADGESYSDPRYIWILGVNPRNYKYELIDKEIETNGFSLLNDMSNVSLGVENLGQELCSYITGAGKFELEYVNACSGTNCNFLGRGNNSFMPSVMYLNEIDCLDDDQVRFLLKFGDFGGYQLPLEPNATLVSEGKWDPKQKRLNMVGCRIFSDWDEGFVGECLIRLSLRFPAQWTLRERSTVVGEMWSSRSVNETGYFDRMVLSSVSNSNVKAPGLRYEYTGIENSNRSCANKTIKKTGKNKFPDALSSDMRFDVIAKSKKVPDLRGYSSPVFVGSELYHGVYGRGQRNFGDRINMSYILSFNAEHDFKLNNEHMLIRSIEISAEGTYDPENGHLCMIGCMSVRPPKLRVRGNSSLDCEILIDLWYPPENRNNGEGVKGNIKSTREKSDRLYFEPLEIVSRSVYHKEAKDFIWRMDLEITMVLISNTLLCIFVGLQILHVKRHANVLPFISVVMLGVLTLGHLVPLLLNFEALFTGGRKNLGLYFDRDEWVEVNEVLVRVITMVAFLLEFRLLQMAWSSRSADESQKNPLTHDRKVLYLLAPLYIGGGLIAWLVHPSRKPSMGPVFVSLHYRVKQPQYLWGDLKSYGGLVLDGFLLPQVLFNIFSDSKEKALVPSFYVGTSLVRLLPHVYDLYWSHSHTWSFGYIYANPRLDYYSTAWDIIISVVGFLFVVLIHLQQRYGGKCFLPRRFWSSLAYEKVPVACPE